ncbi:2-phosphosulfolactate phosphatase [candidate division KSB1 bacterium]
MAIPRVHLIVGAEGCAQASRERGVAVVIDALRASVTLSVMFARGMDHVIVVAEVEDAFDLKRASSDALLVGERGSLKIPGFDFGNSPLALASEDFSGRRAVFTSTTGSRRLIEAGGASAVLVGCVPNVSEVADVARNRAVESGAPVFVIPAGSAERPEEEPSEDIAAAVAVIGRMGEVEVASGGQLFDRFTRSIREKGLETVFREAPHGRELIGKGFAGDVDYCSVSDSLTEVPFVSGTIPLQSGRIGATLTPPLEKSA